MTIAGMPGRLIELRKGDIKTPEYQREVSWPRIKRGAASFDWHLFGTLYVSFRSPDYFVVDGRHRLEMVRLVPEIDLVPCIGFDFDGPEHEAEVFVKLQLLRKPLVTRDMHAAELFAGGDFGATAKAAEAFVEGLDCETVPLASIRKLVKSKPAAFTRVSQLVSSLVGPLALAKDFVEALVYLEDVFEAEGDTLTSSENSRRLFDAGYERLLALMSHYAHTIQSEGRLGKVASPRLKAEALRWALDNSPTFEPVEIDGEAIGARVGIRRTDVAAD
jgi:hypothetical protein